MASSNPSDVPRAEYRQLGQSGLRISVPVLGAMSLGDKRWAPWVIEEDEALPLLKAAYDRGLTSWDTANVYSNGESEVIIAKAIKKYNLPRHKLVIMTKCSGTVREGNSEDVLALKDLPHNLDYVNQYGLSRQAIFNAVNASLRRLETDYIDLLQIHRFDKTVPIEETMKALHDLVDSGKVRYIGASSMYAVQFAQMQFAAEKHGWTKFISMQSLYNLLYREEEREMYRFCNDTGVGLIPWSPLSMGSLARPVEQTGQTVRSQNAATRPPIGDADATAINRVQELAEKKGWPMSHVALAWINKRVSSPIIGFNSIARMDEALAANGKTLTAEEEAHLEEPYEPKKIFGFG